MISEQFIQELKRIIEEECNYKLSESELKRILEFLVSYVLALKNTKA